MSKKLLIGGVIALFIGLIVFSYSFLLAERTKQKQPLEAIPVSACILIESMHLKDTWAHVSATNLVYSQATFNTQVALFDQQLRFADSLIQQDSVLLPLFNNNPSAVSFHPLEDGSKWNYFFATRGTPHQSKAVQNLLSAQSKNESVEKTHLDFTYYVYETNGNLFVYSYVAPLVLFSNSEEVMKESLTQLESGHSLLKNDDFLKVRQNYSGSVSLRTYINVTSAKNVVSKWLNEEGVLALNTAQKTLPQWLSFDLTAKADALIFSGYGWSTHLESLDEAVEQEPTFQSCLPNPILQLNSATYSSIKELLSKTDSSLLAKLAQQCDCELGSSIESWFGGETLKIKFKTENNPTSIAYFLSANDEANLMGQLTQFGVDESKPTKLFGSYAFPINNFGLLQLFGFEGIDTTNCTHFAQIGEFAVFSNLEGLRSIEGTFQSNLTTINENNFLTFQSKLLSLYAQKTNYYLVPVLFEIWKNKIKPEYSETLSQIEKDLSALQAIGIQTSGIGKQLNYITLVVNSNPGGQKVSQPIVSPKDEFLWTVMMKNEITRSPELIKNHQTNTYEIVIQDVENSLHLISPTGKVKWSKPLNEPIMGAIRQIDIYNNGKLQLVFNTASKIYCIDINGNSVSGYPIKLPSNASNSVAIMDYENKHDYRYLIATVDNKILNYDKSGLPVKGWNSKGTKSLVVNPIEHFITAGKDYLYATDINGFVYLLDRKGTVRQTVSGSFKAANQELVYLQKGHSLENCKIVYLNSTNQLEEFSLVSKTSKLTQDTAAISAFWPMDVDGDNKKEWVAATQTKMVVYNSEKQIVYAENFGFPVFNSIRVAGIQKKYIIVEDSQNNTLIVYNHKFEKLTTFKAKASKSATIGDLNNDGKDDLVTIINGKEIISYTLGALYGI